jgi:hypothetical protein
LIFLGSNGLQDFVLPESQVQDGDGGAAAQNRGVAIEKMNVIFVNSFKIRIENYPVALLGRKALGWMLVMVPSLLSQKMRAMLALRISVS